MSILNGFSKVYERFINESMRVIIQIFLSNFVSAHMKHYSANQVLIGLEENWKKNLDNNKIIGTVFKDLSTIFNCIPDDIPIAKMETYGFREDFLTFFIFIPEASKTQPININDVRSIFQILLPCVQQGFILGPFLFNIFINNLFYFIKHAQLLNFADGNTISIFSNSADDLITKPQKRI